MQQDLCPLCDQNLELKQINLEEAVLMCLDLNCPYPFNNEYVVISSSSRRTPRDEQSPMPTNNKDNISTFHSQYSNSPSNVTNPDLMVFDTDAEMKKLISELDMNSTNENVDDVDLYDFTDSMDGSSLIERNFNTSNQKWDSDEMYDTSNRTIGQNQIIVDTNLNDKYAHVPRVDETVRMENNSEKLVTDISLISNYRNEIKSKDTNVSPKKYVERCNGYTTKKVENMVTKSTANNKLKNNLPSVKIGQDLPDNIRELIEIKPSGNDETVIEFSINNVGHTITIEVCSPDESSDSKETESLGNGETVDENSSNIVQEIIMSFDDDDDDDVIF